MQTLPRAAVVLIWPALAWLGACDQADAPTAPMFNVGGGGGPGKVTGGGQIDIVDATTGATIGTASFGFNARREEGTNLVSGHLNFVNHVTGEHLNCKVTEVAVVPATENSPGLAEFGSIDCRPELDQKVEVYVTDVHEPGNADVFTIMYNDKTLNAEGAPIRSGNIQVHK